MSMLRYVAPTRPRFTYVHGSWARDHKRQETRRDETRRIVFRGSHGSASTWIMPVPVRPTRTCPWNSRSRARLDASLRPECSSRLRPQFGRNFVRRVLTLFFSSANTTRRVRPFYQRAKAGLPSLSPIRSRWPAFLILDIYVWQTISRYYVHWCA